MKYIKAALLSLTLVSFLNLAGCYADIDDHDHWDHRDDRHFDHHREEWREHHDRW